ncbi:uncharacterized protein LOC124632739 [Helicoverpa zea]|uniref:uncharacterized protein LOC124632739 n=1 Tax=Helicoverpa zea TaxID=7113 RepID=UPI001F5A8878|nr:uncharacterized protein LOC124632739 [Helicoverpa zea]
MSALSSLFRLFTAKQSFRKPQVALSCLCSPRRAHTDKQDVNSKHAVVSSKVQGTENEDRVRVRRARPADVPRVLRFVREHAKAAWPGVVAPPSASHLVLCDYVARALAQGHSMLAEQQESRRGWSQIRGLALGMSVCPWDASLLERWARCVRCSRSRRLMHFTAHCLRAPALHDKYHVHNILQVILIVPRDSPKNTEIVHVLVKNAIQRGRDVGFPVLRFDVTDDAVANAIDELKLQKEWQLTYDVISDALKDKRTRITETMPTPKGHITPKASNFISVYTAHTDKNIENDLSSETKNK